MQSLTVGDSCEYGRTKSLVENIPDQNIEQMKQRFDAGVDVNVILCNFKALVAFGSCLKDMLQLIFMTKKGNATDHSFMPSNRKCLEVLVQFGAYVNIGD